MPKKVRWIGSPPKKCDICHKPITDEFVDGATQFRGIWGNMCPDCHKKYGNGVGTGSGQRYVKQEDGTFLKVEG